MYNYNYQLTHDMDCFFVLNGRPIHFASNGCIVPSKLGTVNELREIQAHVANMKKQKGFSLNTGFLSFFNVEDFPDEDLLMNSDLRDFLNENALNNGEYQSLSFSQKLYCRSFVEMAAKGFWSFDSIGWNQNGRDMFALIAKPMDNEINEDAFVGPQFELPSLGNWPEDNEQLFCWPLTEMIASAKLKMPCKYDAMFAISERH
ncbi:MAG: hypothetical protein IKX20_08790 [Paludibacteraceae bacterium]|nr:hypothetical protein [Paludibacteraceae bacterium]